MRKSLLLIQRALIGAIAASGLVFVASALGLLPMYDAAIPAAAAVVLISVAALRTMRGTVDEDLTDALADAERKAAVLQETLTAQESAISQVKTEDERSDESRKIAELEDTKLAVLNLLEDIDREKNDASQARARMEAVISSIADGVCVVDDKMRLVMCNPSADLLFGFSSKTMVGTAWEDTHDFQTMEGMPVAADRHPMHAAISGGKPVHDSLFLVKKGGKLPMSISSSPVFSSDKASGAVAVFRDITVEYQLDRAKSEFVSVASHQLRTPLTAINWYAESVADGDYGEVGPTMIEPIQAIRDSSKRMSKLINSLLNVSRIETGNLRIAPAPSDLAEIVGEVLQETELQWKEKALIIDFKPRKDLPQLSADRNLVKIVLQNLITNAIKYTPAKGTVTIDIRAEGKDIVATVADNGMGIPAASRPRIFEKLFRAENASKSAIDGTGLGLYVAKAIVEQSGGTIGFTSEENKGTTFRFTLPLAGVTAKEGTHTLISDF